MFPGPVPHVSVGIWISRQVVNEREEILFFDVAGSVSVVQVSVGTKVYFLFFILEFFYLTSVGERNEAYVNSSRRPAV